MNRSSLVNKPRIVSAEEWQAARNELLVKEKQATQASDALAAERRRLPMVRIEKDYKFETPAGPVAFIDLFEGRQQLLLYHFMYHSDGDRFCKGCSMFVDQIGHLAHIHERNTSFAIVSRAPMASILRHKHRMNWDIPWYSSQKTSFNIDFGVSKGENDQPGLSVFFRDGDEIYRTYFGDGRGIEALGSVWSFLDLTPWGRQELWEDSPSGWPQTPPYEWWNFHDEYSVQQGKK